MISRVLNVNSIFLKKNLKIILSFKNMFKLVRGGVGGNGRVSSFVKGVVHNYEH